MLFTSVHSNKQDMFQIYRTDITEQVAAGISLNNIAFLSYDGKEGVLELIPRLVLPDDPNNFWVLTKTAGAGYSFAGLYPCNHLVSYAISEGTLVASGPISVLSEYMESMPEPPAKPDELPF